jgi:hypothetical protein
MTATVFTEAVHPMAPLIEAVHNLSIDEVVIAASQTIVVGQVLGSTGLTSTETISGAAAAGNVGTTTIGSLSTSASAVNGVYNVVQLTAGATGEFEVGRPDGTIDGVGKIGTAYAGSINFTLTTGGSPAVGDSFSITVTRPFDEAGEQFEAWNPANTDGSQSAIAIAMYPATTGAGQTARIAAVRRDATVRASDLTWNGSATAAQIAYATQQLAAKNIILR